MTIKGKVTKKEKKNNPVKVDLLVEDLKGEVYSIQVRPKNLLKIIEVNIGSDVEVSCLNIVNGNVNNLILEDLKIIQ